MKKTAIVFISLAITVAFGMGIQAAETTLLEDGFEGSYWNGNWEGNWFQSGDKVYEGSSSAKANNTSDGSFSSKELNAQDATSITVSFWFRKDDVDDEEFMLYYYDGLSYILIEDLNLFGGDDEWIYYEDTINDSDYFVDNFKIRFLAEDLKGGFFGTENVWIDNIEVTMESNVIPADNDGDGYTEDVDCDDNDANINPGAAEIECDNIDQDCNGADLCPQHGLNDSFEGSPWNGNWTGNWTIGSDEARTGSYAAKANSEYYGSFITRGIDASGASYITIDFWFMKDDTDTDEFLIYYFNGSNYVYAADLDTLGGDDEWLNYTDTITDDQFFTNDFRIRIEAIALSGGIWGAENVWLDDVNITSDSPMPCIDNDGDSFCACGPSEPPCDCDDTDSSINPGAMDTACDGIDQNCDGTYFCDNEDCIPDLNNWKLTYTPTNANCMTCHTRCTPGGEYSWHDACTAGGSWIGLASSDTDCMYCHGDSMHLPGSFKIIGTEDEIIKVNPDDNNNDSSSSGAIGCGSFAFASAYSGTSNSVLPGICGILFLMFFPLIIIFTHKVFLKK